MPVCVSCLKSAAQYLTIVGQCSVLFFAIIGNILIYLVFTSRKATLYKSPSALYFASLAIVSTLHLVHGVTWQVLSDGFNIDPTKTSLVYCKIREYLTQGTLSKMIYTLECAAVISQYLATSRNVLYRQKNTHKMACWCIGIIVVFWCLHGIPYLVLRTVKINPRTNETRCDSFNVALRHYSTWIGQNLFNFLLPCSILSIFGCLTLRNVRRLGNNTISSRFREQIEQQVTSMLLIQIISVMMGCIPRSIMSIYMLFTRANDKTPSQKAIEDLFHAIIYLFLKISFANSFYLFYGASLPFRKQCKLALPGIFGRITATKNDNSTQPPLNITVL